MGGEESDKIIRVPGENLLIKDSPEEEKYRNKYLPDPTKLTDEKLVCSVCSAALAQDIHKGRTIFVHRLLHVLVCEDCFNFYGDGCFSTDEDGDDKYCRWCGQGGTLYLCSACNCAFCQKCVKQNLKSSVVAELEKDDWKCYFCNPRPLFGCRTICWGAGQLNNIGKENEKERLRKQKERQEKIVAKKKEENGRSRKASSSSEDEGLSKKRKHRQSSDSSSPEVMPKKVKRSSRSQNGNLSRGRKKRNDSESNDSEDNRVSRQSRSRNNRSNKSKKESDSSSSENSDTKTKKRRNKIKSKKGKGTSDESSDEDKKKSKAKNKPKKKVESSEDSSDEKSTNKKKKLKKKKNDSSSAESDHNKKRSNKSKQKKKKEVSSDEFSDDESNKKSTKKSKNEKDSKKKDDDKVEENKSKTDLKEKKTNPQEDALVKKRIKLAIMWLGTALKDISELGDLIAVRAAKFNKKKINVENLKTYDDVLTAVAKLRQLINGVHSNYDHIEKTLDSQLKPWKILTGLQEADEKPAEEAKAPEDSIAEDKESDVKDEPNSRDHLQQKPAEKNDAEDNTEMQLRLSEEIMSPDDDSETDQCTRDAVARASELLEKDQELENSEVSKGVNDNDSTLNSSLSNDGCNQSAQEEEHSQTEPDQTAELRSDDSDADSKTKMPKKSGYKSLLGSSIKKNPDGEKTSVNDSVVEGFDSEGVPDKGSGKSVIDESDSEVETGKDSNKPEEDLDSDGGEPSKELSSPDKAVKEDSSVESAKESTKEKPKPLSKKENIRKGKHDSEAAATRADESRPTPLLESSSDESNQLDQFKKQVKDKWGLPETTEEMNLKTSLGIDSSGESDAGLELTKNSKKGKIPKKKPEEGTDSDNKGAKKKKMEKTNSELSEKKKEKLKKDNSENDASEDDKIKKSKPAKANKNGENSDIADKSKKHRSKESKNKKESSKKRSKKHKSKHGAAVDSETDPEPGAGKKSKKCDKDGNAKREISDDEVSKKSPPTVKKEDSDNEECSLEPKGKNKHSKSSKQEEGDDVIPQEGTTKESKDSALFSEIENAVLDKSNSGEIKIKFVGLDSTSEEEVILDVKKENEDEVVSDKQDESKVETKSKEKSLKTISERNKRRSTNVALLDSSDDEQEVEEQAPLQTISSDDEQKELETEDKDDGLVELDSADSSDSEIIPSKKRKKKSSSESEASVGSDEDKEDKKKKKRKRIRCADDSSEESSGSGDGKVKRSKKSSQGESPGKGGRKNIKKIKSKDDLADATKEAAEEEKERRKRIEERQKLFNQVFETKKAVVLDKLVLDFDLKEKQELISVNKDLVSKMKPHQAKGVKFMWDSCFESVSQLKKKKGSGCILAHCMGLGKTFQVISLVHTLLTHDDTEVRTVMVVCPLSTVLNWYNEFGKWLDGVEGSDDIEVFHLTKCKQNPERARELRRWQHNGGVMIIGYEMFRNLACETNKKFKGKLKKDFQESLIDPGADIVICDEGHMLKNEATALSKAMTRVKTLRRVVLTGTPMQNNLTEYHCMVQFVKPNLLGTKKEFLNRFVNPITNGQFVDSTEADVKVMKRRAHVLHKMLEGLVQRFDYNVLTPFLPPKHEYVISVCLSELQIKLYQHYLREYSQQSDNTKGGARLFQDWQALGRIWTHPRVLKLSTDKANWLKEKKMMEDSDEEGSLKDFVVDGSEDEDTSTPEESSDDGSSDESGRGKKKAVRDRHKANTRATRSSTRNRAHLESEEEEKEGEEAALEEPSVAGAWWSEFIETKDLDDIRHSGKLILLFQILRECEMIEDKVLVFSQSLFSLDLIEYFLDKIDAAGQNKVLDETLGNHQGTWSRGLDYFRLDGSTSSENRNIWCKSFNSEDNPRARLFLISTRAGGLGINLTAANRVVIFDASWNPSHDVQSIFRVYRFGQKKPCYIYRFIAHGTMEEKVYDRQVAKQSISNRVVDEQQVHRHFSSNDLNELYSFTPPSKMEDKPIPALPTDVLLAELLSQFGEWIEKYHEHDSLLENVVEEELNEEERKLAWEDFENDKKRGFLPNPGTQGYGNNYVGANNISGAQIEYLRQQLKVKYPNKSENELNQILVYQVSIIMRQQQLAAAQNQAGMSAAGTPQPFPGQNMTPDQLFKLQQHQQQMQWMQQMQQLKMQQQQLKQQQMNTMQNNLQGLLQKPQQMNTMQNSLQGLLQKPQQMSYQQQMMLQQQANLARVRMQQTMNQPPAQPMNFQAPKQKLPGVTITELPDDSKESKSET